LAIYISQKHWYRLISNISKY